ncbi:MAG: glycosyltransferase [Candidatus Nanoarchaeia archaeon]
MKQATPKVDTLFEVAWEVCNKVGGIYTVVKSKAAIMNEKYNNYFMIGPLNHDNVRFEAEQAVPPEWLKEALDELEKQGVHTFFGKWITKGSPYVILIDFTKFKNKTIELRKWLWENYSIESHVSGWDFDEPMLWSYAVSVLLKKVSKKVSKKTAVHLHEWMAGLTLLFLKNTFRTVFTTHATMLGRSMAGSGYNIYNMLDELKPREMAEKLGVLDKYTTEKACAHNANVFTTVSEITSLEAEKVLGKKADVLLLNGLDIDKFPTFEESSIQHRQYREKAREFCSLYFFPHYKFDLEQSLFYFIVGRYEFKNKGVDLFIDALGELNKKLKEEDSKKTIIAFFWIPASVQGIHPRLLENKEQFEQVEDFVQKSIPQIKQKVIRSIMGGEELECVRIFEEEDMQEINSYRNKFIAEGTPLLSTHRLFNQDNDAIINAFKNAGLNNLEEDKVKVIFYPVYLDGFDRLLELKYYKAIQACHLGVFPSYYEPWGYTPLESAALGVPSVTTDLAGFGRFIRKKQQKEDGIYVVDRLNNDYKQGVKQLSKKLYEYSLLQRKDRVEQKMAAKKLAELADWKILTENYITAHNKALGK